MLNNFKSIWNVHLFNLTLNTRWAQIVSYETWIMLFFIFSTSFFSVLCQGLVSFFILKACKAVRSLCLIDWLDFIKWSPLCYTLERPENRIIEQIIHVHLFSYFIKLALPKPFHFGTPSLAIILCVLSPLLGFGALSLTRAGPLWLAAVFTVNTDQC